MGVRIFCPSCGTRSQSLESVKAYPIICYFSPVELSDPERERTKEMTSSISYRRRGYGVEARQFETTRNPPTLSFLDWLPDHAIFTWKKNGTHIPEMQIDIQEANRPAVPGDWVVKTGDSSWQVLNHEQFKDMYEAVPNTTNYSGE